MAAFTKNDEVTFIASWDRKGTYFYQHAVVYSCGEKQMVLTCEVTGKEMGRHYTPVVGDVEGTLHRLSDTAAVAQCLVAATVFLVKEKASIQRLLECNTGNIHYCKCMQEQLTELHEPRALQHKEWVPS